MYEILKQKIKRGIKVKNIFVDGYNVINSWPELKSIKEYSFEAARQKLNRNFTELCYL